MYPVPSIRTRSIAMSDVTVTLCTCPDRDSAERIAHALVDARLAACVSTLPGVTSTYRWQGEVQQDSEHLLLIKSTPERAADLLDRILELHPYDVPEVLTLPVATGLPAYLHWVAQSTDESESAAGRS